jgi:uncharacterized protein YkwD
VARRYRNVDLSRHTQTAALCSLAIALIGGVGAAPALGAASTRASSSGCAKATSLREGNLGKPPAGCRRPVVNGVACANAGLTPTRFDIRKIRAATLCLVNRARLAHGELALRLNPALQRAAQRHTESMAFGDYFEHIGPAGQTPAARMRAAGYISSRRAGYEVGENLAMGTLWLATPRAIVSGWMASPGHRANILDPRFRDTAIGISPHPPAEFAHGRRGAVYTQDFGVIIHARIAR